MIILVEKHITVRLRDGVMSLATAISRPAERGPYQALLANEEILK